MKIYIVTAGEYSNYHIEKVFTDRTLAQMYANLDNDRMVEEYPVDDTQISCAKMIKANISYDFSKDEIQSITQVKSEWPGYEPHVSDLYSTIFYCCIALTGKLLQEVSKDGMHSKMLLQAVRDVFYKELDRLGTSRQALIDEKRKLEEEYDRKFTRNYPMYKTSGNPFEEVVTEEVSDKLDEMYQKGEPLPDVMTLTKMILDSREKAKENKDDRNNQL